MANKGSWSNGRAPAQGAAGVKQKSKGELASGFKFGLNNMVEATKAADPLPKGSAVNSGESIQPCSGVWHPGAERP